MSPFKWSRKNEVYVPQVDAEHRAMFRIADELQRAALAGAEPELIRSMLRNLATHAEDHFRHEERLMQSTGYPAYAWHRRQHDTVRSRVNQFLESIDGGDQAALQLLLEFLSGWLRDHTSITDRMMGSHLRNYERRHAARAS